MVRRAQTTTAIFYCSLRLFGVFSVYRTWCDAHDERVSVCEFSDLPRASSALMTA